MQLMDAIETGQVNRSAAEVYEEFFIPALFQQWTGRVLDVAHVQTGQRVLDVACGTGILARAAGERVGAAGSVVGIDINPAMLSVAARKAPHMEWREGRAEALPFDDHSFDAVVSQFGLMFFEDWQAALREMLRVLKPSGHLAIAVWGSLESSAGYAAMVDLLQRLFGEKVANGLRPPFALGDLDKLQTILRDAGITNAEIATHRGSARFPSIEAWVYTDVKGWVMADMLNDAQFQRLLTEAQRTMSSFVNDAGEVVFDAPAHIISVTKT
jgi:SAM-dependent methyltransferase